MNKIVTSIGVIVSLIGAYAIATVPKGERWEFQAVVVPGTVTGAGIVTTVVGLAMNEG